jgi:hypothetical protein
MNKKSILVGATVLILGGLVMSPKLAGAYQGDPNVQGPNCTPERHEAMVQAFDNNDYNTWKELMSGKGKVSQVITEENFARFAEAYKLAQDGKLDEAKQIRQELGLGLGNRNGSGDGQGNKGQAKTQGWNK